MIFDGEFVAGIDLVDVCLWLFTLFFFGLIFYLRREDRREGYPLETDTTGKQEASGTFWMPPKKKFHLPHGRGTLDQAFGPRDDRELALKRTAVWPGAPYEPTGDPLQDGVGPASYAMREDVPDLTLDGEPRIAPYRDSPGFEVAKQDKDPRGLTIYGVDGQAAGTVVDLWVDRSEAIIRYLEIETTANDAQAGQSERVLVPMPFVIVRGGRRKARVTIEAVTAEQLRAAPKTKEALSVTRREEDRISGYFGGGKLYATPDRKEPWI
ncbi:MAG: photosynthetic reaction center subunit H [Pseudomonadota bacterium]